MRSDTIRTGPAGLTMPWVPASLIHRLRKRHPVAGSPPGTLCVPDGAPPPRIRVVEYDADSVDERDVARVASLAAPARAGMKRWVDVQGLGDEAVLRELGAIYELHNLLLEDVVNIPQLPKSEVYERNHFFVTRMFHPGHGDAMESEQVSIVVGRDVVITFQERPGDVFDPVRRRLRDGLGVIRSSGADYLAYALLDTVVDHYFPVMEELGRSIEELEEAVLLRGDERTMHHLLTVKSRLLGFRRAVRPQAEALTRLMRDGSPWVGEAVLPFFRDTLDHCNQCIEIVDTYRELVTGLLNTHLSVVSNRTNEVMKVLTIIASIFIPLTLLAGIYGMNFDHMPELHSRWAYPSVLAVMLFAAGFMLLYFRRKGWIGRRDERDER